MLDSQYQFKVSHLSFSVEISVNLSGSSRLILQVIYQCQVSYHDFQGTQKWFQTLPRLNKCFLSPYSTNSVSWIQSSSCCLLLRKTLWVSNERKWLKFRLSINHTKLVDWWQLVAITKLAKLLPILSCFVIATKSVLKRLFSDLSLLPHTSHSFPHFAKKSSYSLCQNIM